MEDEQRRREKEEEEAKAQVRNGWREILREKINFDDICRQLKLRRKEKL